MVLIPVTDLGVAMIMLAVLHVSGWEVIPRHSASLSLEGTGQHGTTVRDEVRCFERADRVAMAVVIAIHAALRLVGLQTAIVELQEEETVVLCLWSALTPTDRLVGEGVASI